uniref:Potassium channel toxin alpha-KTx 22.1 n=1 Tax=Olivierus martensii TaxID=34649 RepID=KA221_OLIMR|nr:RecName: Full=Potassium channel toxin alpha-KTx 22.1; AltName: Full=Neurotoxin BmK38; AltName: Full=Toxin Kcugx; Flags: Precursor [Mesobuthus martensii]AEX92698.1 potassium channel toxin alpha-KTx 22.1 precursor [Mesobuthus martensii]AEX92704.1 potassium channel toxin alpha-KTx 22.1 precursor [Mesobuthus martensii]
MQKLFIVFVLFCILRLDAEVDGRTATFCTQSICEESCKRQNKNGRCVIEAEGSLIYHLCKCY